MLWLKVEVPGWEFSPYWLTMVSMQRSPSSQTRMLQKAKGTVNRVGLGKARHIQTRYLWLQERVAENHLKVVHVPGKQNRSDVLTKPVPGTQMHQTMAKSEYVYLTDRSKGQLNLLK